MSNKVLLIDNNDSFTFNLVQLLEESGLCSFQVVPYQEIHKMDIPAFDKILISPGPGVPSELPLLSDIILRYASTKNILGICLGFQAIVEAFGGRLMNLQDVRHGQRVQVYYENEMDTLFQHLENPFTAGLYHSWAADPLSVPTCLKVTARDPEGIIMAVKHMEYQVTGLQFHPESFMTSDGIRLIKNWLSV